MNPLTIELSEEAVNDLVVSQLKEMYEDLNDLPDEWHKADKKYFKRIRRSILGVLEYNMSPNEYEEWKKENVKKRAAEAVHRAARQRHGDEYQTPGYYLRLYRKRADLTQAALAKKVDVLQHDLSEMEHNKRPIGKATAKKLAQVLDCDYRKFME
jgi:DNA-binding XRE family transcriptional regulator